MTEQTQTTAPQLPTHNQQPWAVPGAIVVAGALIAGALYFAQPKQQMMPPPDGGPAQNGPQATEQTVKGLQADDYVVGDKNAEIVIVEFSDSECPFCKMFHDTMNKIMGEYGPSGKVAWVYRHYPLEVLHRKAHKEAIAQECVGKLGGNDAFWKFTNNIYAVTPSNDGLNHAELPGMAVAAGVDKAAFESCFKNDETKDAVKADMDEGAALGIGGTPQSYIIKDGQQYSIEGAQPYGAVKQLIEKLLAE
jgi:protein-disulfide isomerase